MTLDGKLYVLGGFDSARAVLAVVHVYDPKANAWSTAAPLPRPLHHVNATVVGDRLWITGALESMAFTATGDVLMFDPKLDVWTAKAPMPAGSERGSAMVGAIGKTVYVAGGLRGGAAVSDFASYDTELGVWTTLPVLPLARDHGAGAIAGDVFFAVGGRSSSIGAHTARVDAFDIAKGAWSDRAPMPTSRAGFALAVAKGRLVVMGGEGDPRRDSAVFPEVEAYDPSSNTWTPLPAMTTPRHGMGAASVDDVVFAPGGGTRQAFAATEVVEALTF